MAYKRKTQPKKVEQPKDEELFDDNEVIVDEEQSPEVIEQDDQDPKDTQPLKSDDKTRLVRDPELYPSCNEINVPTQDVKQILADGNGWFLP